MCGIIGVVSKDEALNLTVEGLKKVQYRGYDSAGVCVQEHDKICLYKCKGKIENLEKLLPNAKFSIAIGHTRWATHGKVCEQNAHPLLSQNHSWAIVHNGIIENYKPLAERLSDMGVAFKSQTDSEVICQLLGLNKFNDAVRNVNWTAKQIDGSYAFCAMKEGCQALYAAKNKSPLYAFCSEGLSMFASDPICFPKGDYYCLNDGEICELKAGKVRFFNDKCEEIQKTKTPYQSESGDAGKGGYEHFMLKEIYETPAALLRLAKSFDGGVKFSLKGITSVKLIGCGTAYHACLMGELYFKKYLKMDAQAVQASEFDSCLNLLSPHSLCIFVSQSGETADTIRALENAKPRRAKTFVMTNVAHSTLARMSPGRSICAGPEIAVASTKAYTCQIACLYLFVMALKGDFHLERARKNIMEVAKTLDGFFINMASFAQDIASQNQVFFIGKGEDYVTALEGALKLKEISYINCNAYPAGELKHGVLALIEEGTPVIVIATDEKSANKTFNSALEAKSRGAKLYLVSSKPPLPSELTEFEICLSLPKCPNSLRSILAIKPLQLLSYLVSSMRGINPDMPRNLAKSVTVE